MQLFQSPRKSLNDSKVQTTQSSTEYSSVFDFASCDFSHMNSLFTSNQSFYRKMFGKKGTTIEEYVYVHLNLYTRLCECNSPMSFMLTIHSYFKDILGVSHAQFTRDYEPYVISFFFLCLGVQLKRAGSSVSYAQSASGDKHFFKKFLTDVREQLGRRDKVLNSDFAQRFGSFCSLLVCTPIFVKLGVDSTLFGFSDKFQKDLQKKYEARHVGGLVIEIIDTTTYILDKVILYLETGSMHALYIDDQELVEYEELYSKLTHYSDKFSLMANIGWTIDDYLNECDRCIERGKKLLCFFHADRFKLSTLKTQQAQLAKFKLRAADKLQVQAEREAPLGFIFYGTPGIGKSALTDKFLHCLYENDKQIRGTGHSYDPKYKYMYNEDDEYFSEFKTSHEVCILDDIDQFNDDITKQKNGGSIAKSIYLINPMPYITNQASLEDKGMIPFRCKYVIGTTNIYDAGISKVFKKEGGAPRRFVFLEATVKSEYCKENSTQLEGDLTPEGYKNHEMHTFFVRMYFSSGSTSIPYYWNVEKQDWVLGRDSATPMSLAQLSRFCYEKIQLPAFVQNNKSKESVNHFLSKPYCHTCKVPGALCSCHDIQSYIEEINNDLLKSVRLYDKVGFVVSLMMLFSVAYAAVLYVLHVITMRCTDRNRPNIFTKRLINHIKYMPNCYSLPFWFNWIPTSFAAYCCTEGWLTWCETQCRRAHSVGMLTHSFCVDKQYRTKRYQLAFFLSCLGSAAVVAKMFATFYSSQSSTEDTEEEEEQVNHWKVNFQDITRLEGAPSTVTKEQLVSVASSNTCVLVVETESQRHWTNGFGICGNYVAVPAHWVDNFSKHFPCKLHVYREDTSVTAGSNRLNLIIDRSNFSHTNSIDVMLFRHASLSPFRDLRKFLVIKPILGKLKGTICVRQRTGVISHVDVHGLEYSTLNYKSDKAHFSYPGYVGLSKQETSYGYCGAPYVVETNNGLFIAGIHVAGKPANMFSYNRVSCAPLREIAVSRARFVPHAYNGMDLNSTYQTEQDLSIRQTQHPKCPLRDTTGPSVEVFGSIESHRRKMKTRVCETLMVNDVLKEYNLLEPKHISPAGISSRQAAINNLDPMFEKPSIAQSFVNRAEDALYEWYVREIEACDIEMPQGPLDLSSAINGIDGVAYMERMPVKTSGGFAHKGRKDKYLEVLPQSSDEHTVEYKFNDDVQKEYDAMIDKYMNGERNNVIWDFNFKDEPITHEKLRKQKCRIFNSGPMAFIALERQFFLWCIPFFSGKYRHKFGMALGANSSGPDWKTLYEYIIQHGEDQVIAGDYSKFDKRMSAQMMTAAFNVLINIMKRAGWDDLDIYIATGIATDVCYPVSNAFGTIIQTDGSNPSGHSLTTVINGMVNIMYIMIAGMIIEEEKGISEINYSEFQKSCSILTYGDDNAMSCKPKWFTHKAISAALNKVGVVYTTADKESEIKDFIHASELEFLKREFIVGRHGPDTVASPLSEDSIIKMLTVVVKSSTISFEEQCAAVICSANREYFQYGREICNEKKKFLEELLFKFDLYPYIPCPLKTYEEFWDETYGVLKK